jgi:hypothetical protein
MTTTHIESEPRTEHREQEHPEVINPGLVVERRTVGDITYVVALCEHVGEFADTIKGALAGCDYLAIEQQATPTAKNAATKILSGRPTKRWAKLSKI